MIGLKKYQKFIKALAAFLVLVVICIPLIGSGTSYNDAVRVLNPILNAPFNKELIVTFDYQLKASTVNSKNVYVTDNKNVRVPVKISTGSDGKSIIVLPQKNYECGKTYMLYITGNVCYKSGKRVGILIKRQFTISNNKELTDLPLVGSIDNLKKLLSETDDYNSRVYYTDGIINGNSKKSASTQSETNTDYSKTNLQVAGVDEADTVKTDGNYIYKVSNNKIFIVKTNDGKMDIESILNYNNFEPGEIYVDGNYMVVLGNSYNEIPVIYNGINKDSASKKPSLPFRCGCVKSIIYDITDRKNPRLQREYEIEGNYVSSRKIGNNVYLVSNKHQYYYEVQDGGNITPSYRDTSKGNDFTNIGCDKIRYFPGFVRSCFMTISGIDISNPAKPVDMSTYLGSGDEIYASEKNLYAAVTHYVKTYKGTIIQRIDNSTDTDLYKFGLSNGKAGYIAKSEIKGTVLNQFSMDEYNGCFRIAATSGDMWRNDESTSKNNVYVFDDMMNLKGKIEGIAPGEKIYSVRFMGDKGYVVTFKTVDPLFVIDLKNPASPKILGALKIPDYSNYIEPYDENHIIGFGKDAVEGTQKDSDGNVINSTAYYMGMKMAIFDVTDFSNPKVMYEEKIGDRGTDSEILYNHKALLFSKEKNLIAFPVTVMEANSNSSNSTVPAYGKFAFQGAYIYNISLTNGFVLKGKITHLSHEDYLKSGDYWYNSNKNITRVLYIGNNIYTISNSMIGANRMSDLVETGSIVTE